MLGHPAGHGEVPLLLRAARAEAGPGGTGGDDVTCPDVSIDLGAYVLGALEPGGAAPGRGAPARTARPAPPSWRSSGRCRRCWTGCGPEDLQPVAVTPSPDLFDRMSAAAAGSRGRPPPRSRTWALVAAAVLAVLGVGRRRRPSGPTGTGEQTAHARRRVRSQVTVTASRGGRRQRAGRHRRRAALRARSAGWSPSTTTGERHDGGRVAGLGRRATARGGAGPTSTRAVARRGGAARGRRTGAGPRDALSGQSSGSSSTLPMCSLASTTAVRLGGPRHRQPAVDDRPDDAALDVGPHVVPHGGDDLGLAAGAGRRPGPQRRGVHRGALAHQLPEVELGLRAALHADDDQPAADGQGVDVAGQVLARPCCRG